MIAYLVKSVFSLLYSVDILSETISANIKLNVKNPRNSEQQLFLEKVKLKNVFLIELFDIIKTVSAYLFSE